MTPNPSLAFHALTTGYCHGSRQSIVGRGLEGSLPRGTLTVLLGTNGAGKSTLLRTLAGLQPPLAGDIFWEGNSLASLTPEERAKRLSIVLTVRPETGNLTVREVVALGRLPHRQGLWGSRNAAADAEAVERAMRLTTTSAWSERPVSRLSDGERQRVFIAKALAQETPLILLDEPTAFLDYPSRVQFFNLLKRLTNEMGKTILLSSHDVELAAAHADRILLLSKESLCLAPTEAKERNHAIRDFFQLDAETLHGF
ncbi:MAG: ABC transporter ATP-binding protein [Bacteroidales bacterium]|nr:ABC transporter ATP-binding protein [Bacteroidales bacterium]MCI7167486.1 ABC transporter ATP-binding protein [Bacteroidales bacterium]